MKSIWLLILAEGMIFTLGLSPVMANGPTTRPSSKWVPPVLDAPVDRGVGAARCPTDSDLILLLLCPSKSVGLTAKTQPTLYWYVSKPTNIPIEVALTPLGPGGKDIKALPVLDVFIPKTETAGIQAFSLARPPGKQEPVSLKPGVQYKWAVEFHVKLNDGANNPVTFTRLQCINAPDNVSAAQSAALMDQYEADRQAGLWYDMIDTLSQMIGADKDNADLHQVRQALLKDQNLKEDDDGKITEIDKAK